MAMGPIGERAHRYSGSGICQQLKVEWADLHPMNAERLGCQNSVRRQPTNWSQSERGWQRNPARLPRLRKSARPGAQKFHLSPGLGNMHRQW